jgi:TolA-binding protein
MMRAHAAVLLAAALHAPLQCASEPEPNRRRAETPAEALWRLSERFRAEGDQRARRTTLQELVTRYPNSREAGMAREDLAVPAASR